MSTARQQTGPATATATAGKNRTAGGAADGAGPPPARHRWWPLAKRVLTVLFFAAVAWLIYRNARNVDWREVGAVLLDYPNGTLWLAAAVAAASHAIYGTFDLLGRHWTGHGLAVRQVVPVTFVSYAFNLNLGSLVGGIAFRYRLYSRLGLDTDTTSRVLGLSLVTNWLGYLVLAGGVFALRVITPPDDWKFGATALQVLGFALLAAAAGYLALCAARAGHEYSVRGHRLVVPSLRMALLQLALSMANWAVIAGVIYVLLQFKLPYPLVLGVLLIAAVAGVVAHIPAGLGVLEAVFIALLGHRVPQGELLAALIAYRAIYYLAPMLAATALYLTLEARAKKGGSPAAPALHGKAA
ncbi:MAG: UPF0104 family protein [Methylibium sp.]|nr:UPF0104 family protein [Methylibium sp.]